MSNVVAVWLLIVLAVAVLGITGAVVGWDRYRPRRATGVSRAYPTDEVFIDPETSQRMRVWFDPATGARDYRPE